MALLDDMFYYPSRRLAARPEQPFEAIHFRTSDDVLLSGWWFPAEPPARGTVVHCHGNAGNVAGHFQQVAWLPACGFQVLCFDYRGYGESGGRISRPGSILDTHAAIEAARARGGCDRGGVMLFGQSLGGAVAIVAAAERGDVAGVAVDGPFSEYRAEVRWVLRRRWWTRGVAGVLARAGVSRGCDPIDYVARVAPTPLFLMHGKQDRICPWEMSQDLYDRAGEPKALWLIPEANHYQALAEMADLARPKLLGFFDACASAAASG